MTVTDESVMELVSPLRLVAGLVNLATSHQHVDHGRVKANLDVSDPIYRPNNTPPILCNVVTRGLTAVTSIVPEVSLIGHFLMVHLDTMYRLHHGNSHTSPFPDKILHRNMDW
jgi:hypothetical protein